VIMIFNNLRISLGTRYIKIGTLCILFWWLSFALVFIFTLYVQLPSIMISFLLFGILGFLLTSVIEPEANALYLLLYFFSTIISLLLYFNFNEIYGSPYWGGGSDELMYEDLGKKFAVNFGFFDYSSIRGELVSPWHNSVGYIYLIGILTKMSIFFGGDHTMIFRIFNAACLGMLCVFVYSMSKKVLLNRDTVVWTAIIVGILPIMLWVAGQTLRDVIASLFLTIGAQIWVCNSLGKHSTSNITRIIFTLLLFPVLFEMRKAQAYILLLIAITGLIVGTRFNNVVYKYILSSIILLGLLFVYFSIEGSNEILAFSLEAEHYSTYRVEETGGGLSSVVFTSPAPFSYFFSALYALISPIPEINFKAYSNLLSLGTIFQIFFIPFLVNGIRKSFYSRYSQVLFISFLLPFIGMSMFTFTIRHIVQYLPFAVILTSLGYEHYQGDRKLVFYVMGGFIGLFSIFYLFLKY
jgi:hypothetical protein